VPAGTTFQKAVWRHLVTIPAGTTTTYGEVARRLRMPGASRAVGQAVGANPLPILIPCHRVLAAGSKLGGYSAGLRRKRWLLAHEGLAAREG
jgi:methylated-DNA-[protein]-cysteine S-methyltransferase